ncbi:MAG TPA: hypothetical protein PK765_00965 [bacterium]|nr:hypothetical protein [bacterium]
MRAVRDLRLQYSDDSVALATIGRYVTLRERYDQVRDLLKRIGELLEHGCSGGPTAPHRHIILQDAAMIIAEKLDRGCDNVAMVETLKETAAVLLGVERIEDARSIEVIREVP